MTSVSLMHEAGHPKLVLWGNPEGQDGEGGGKEVQDGVGHIYTYGQFTLMLLGRKLDMNKRGGLAEGDAS